MTRLAAFPILALAALSACAEPPPGAVNPYRGDARPVLTAQPRPYPSRGIPVAEATASGTELRFVGGILADLQRKSFANNREYCGYIGLDPAGRWMATPVTQGNEASCPLPNIPTGMRLVASFHTHGTYSPHYASEWPTTQDMATDASDDIDGYISTPGGRLWHVDTDTMTVHQMCGRGCLPQDPNYVAAEDGPVRRDMSYQELLIWENTPVAVYY
jgi:hypothetical protein